MKLQDYLNTNDLRKAIDDNYIDKRMSPCNNFYLLDYSRSAQYDQVWTSTITKCRGLIIDNNNDDIVGMVPVKFFNLTESVPSHLSMYKDCIDKKLRFIATEKMDGSFICTFFDKYQKKWRCATRGSFSSPQAIWSENWLHTNTNPKMLLPGDSYIFETIYPENRIVVDYGKTEELVMLTGFRECNDRRDWAELSRDEIILISSMLRVRWVPEHHFNSIDDVVKDCETLDSNHEGYVLQFENGFRIKCKGQDYVKLHRILLGLTSKSIWAHIDRNTWTIKKDFLMLVPEEFLPSVESFGNNLIEAIKSEFDIVMEAKDLSVQLAIEIFGGSYTKRDYVVNILKKRFPKEIFHKILLAYGNRIDDLKEAIWEEHKPEFEKLSTLGDEEE